MRRPFYFIVKRTVQACAWFSYPKLVQNVIDGIGQRHVLVHGPRIARCVVVDVRSGNGRERCGSLRTT